VNATIELEAPAGAAAPEVLSAKSFAIGLAVIATIGLTVRVAAAFFFDARTGIGGDAVWYTGVARHLALGDGFIEPLQFFLGRRVPTAAHPPLYPMYLSLVDFTVGGSLIAHRLWSCLPGVGTVVLLGLVGRDLCGRRAGLIAAALGAVSIELFVQDVLLWSEGLYGFTIALTVFTAYRYLRRPDLVHVALLAGAIALAALARAEAILLFVILLVPLVLRARDVAWVRRFAALGVGALVAIALIGPWLAYNNSGRFKRPVGVTVTFGTLIGASYCHNTFYGPSIGAWGGLCPDTVPTPWPLDESIAESRARTAGFDYLSDHLDRLPIVIPYRLARSFGFSAPTKTISDDLLLDAAHVEGFADVALAQYWLLLGLGIVGGVTLFRRRVASLPIAAPVITVAVITVIGYGSMRFRLALDVVLPILAAVAIESFLTRRARSPSSPRAPGTVATDS
jgi:hypothetical protein